MASETGLSRRDLMKKGAVAGAIVWSAPLLTSTPAFAATTECGGSQPCTTWYYAKVEGSDRTTSGSCSGDDAGDGTDDGRGNGCVNLLAEVGCPGATVTSFSDGCSLLNAAGTFTHTGGTATVTFPAGAVPLFIQIKPGDNCYTYQWNGSEFVFFNGTDGTTAGPGACLTSITDTVVDGKIKVDVVWNQGGSACNGISHFNAYFCL
jgi:hypothetical protein